MKLLIGTTQEVKQVNPLVNNIVCDIVPAIKI